MHIRAPPANDGGAMSCSGCPSVSSSLHLSYIFTCHSIFQMYITFYNLSPNYEN